MAVFKVLLLLFFLSTTYVHGQRGHGGAGGGGVRSAPSGRGGGRSARRPTEDTELSALLTRLWNEDPAKARYVAAGNRGGANVDVRINAGGRTRSGNNNDAAPQPLFTYVNERVLFSHPTTRLLIGLFDDFRLSTSVAEDQETNFNNKREVNNFLTAIINTNVMKKTFDFVKAKRLLRNPNPQSWRRLLYTIWFKLYSRHRGVLGSSGFEHVFLGEIDDGQVKGIHNWVWAYKQEKQGSLDYKGSLSSLSFNPCLVRGRFTLRPAGRIRRVYGKPMTSFLVGSTPEFEMALFTLAFLKHPNGVANFKINAVNFKVQTWKNRDGTLGSAYFQS